MRLELAKMVSRTTQKSLMDILRFAQEHPETAASSRWDMWMATRELISDLKITLEVPMAKEPSSFAWVLLHPGRLVTKMVQECGKSFQVFAIL